MKPFPYQAPQYASCKFGENFCTFNQNVVRCQMLKSSCLPDAFKRMIDLLTAI